jgi:hypothetical protein
VPLRLEKIEERLADLRAGHHFETGEKFSEKYSRGRAEVFLLSAEDASGDLSTADDKIFSKIFLEKFGARQDNCIRS